MRLDIEYLTADHNIIYVVYLRSYFLLNYQNIICSLYDVLIKKIFNTIKNLSVSKKIFFLTETISYFTICVKKVLIILRYLLNMK